MPQVGSVGHSSSTSEVGKTGGHGAEEAHKHHKREEAKRAIESLANGMGAGAGTDPAAQGVVSAGQVAAPSQVADNPLKATAAQSK